MASYSSLPKVNTQFTPIQLKGHEKSLTGVKYNLDGDLLFSSAKDNKPCVWYADTGERLGTYFPHGGAVWDIDPSWDSKYVLTGCADENARIFETTTGNYYARMPHKGVVRSVKWADSPKFFATASDPFTSRDLGCVSIYDFPEEDMLIPYSNVEAVDRLFVREGDNPEDAKVEDRGPIHKPKMVIHVDDNDKAICINWSAGDRHILAGMETGWIVKYDAEYGKEVLRKRCHNDRINRLNFNRDKSVFVTASRDNYAKLIDPETLETVRDYKTDRPVNGAAICPTHPHVLVGGGQEADKVTTTSGNKGKFQTRFFHMVYGEEFGRVKGHFGPINAVDVHPYGLSFASGSEDGYVNLCHFDANYVSMPDYLPEGFKM